MNLKALIEARNQKVTDMEALVAKAKAENRLVSDEEKNEFNSLKKEVADLDENIAIQKEVENFGLVKAPEDKMVKEDTVEAKERKQFANVLRSIRNTDTPTTTEDGKVMIPTTVWGRIISKVADICPIYDWADKFNIKGNFIIPKDDDEGTLAVDYADDFSRINTKLLCISFGNGFLIIDKLTVEKAGNKGISLNLEADVALSYIKDDFAVLIRDDFNGFGNGTSRNNKVHIALNIYLFFSYSKAETVYCDKL